MKVLMLQGYYEPEVVSGLYLVTNLVEDLNKSDYIVDIVTPIPSRGISDEIRNKYITKKLESKLLGKTNIHRYWMPKESSNTLLRALRYLMGGILHIVKSIKIKSDVIVINSTPPTNGLIGVIVKRLKRIPVVYILQDIFPDSMITSKMTKEGSLIWKIGRLLENFTYKNVDKIIVISEDFKRNIMDKGVQEEKIHVIRNWVDENKVLPINKEENQLIKELGLDINKFYVVYAGNIGNAQNIEVILKVAKETEQISDIEYIIFGNGVQEEFYKSMALDMKLNNLKFYPLQPYDMVSHVYSLGDISIVSCKEGFGTSAMPSKTWSIMSTGTAVIANFDEGTELQDIIENNELGIFTKAGDVLALKEAIISLYKDRELCKNMGGNGRQYILDNLSRKIQVSKYIDVLKSIGGEKYYV